MFRKIADFLLITYLFIATAGLCFVLATYILLGQKARLTPLSMFVFFSTLLIYNFHRVSPLFSNIPFNVKAIFKTVKAFPVSSGIMKVVAVAGIAVTSFLLQWKTLAAMLPLALISFAYSVPILKVGGKRKRLREIFIIKITTLSLIWSISTVILPMIDSGVSIVSSSSVLIFIERFLFMFAICIPFEIRDMEQEKKWGITTLPQIIGVNWCKSAGIASLFIFMMLVFIQVNYLNSMSSSFVIPLGISCLAAALLITYTHPHRNKYYFRILTDGTMQLQFILLFLFNTRSG